jgi:NAD(P)-dependent dehydrogenase (short-subunit alcohol dehydrogenase family)
MGPILITGATDGLGRGLALALARDGADLILHGRSAERGEAVVEAARDAGAASVEFVRADLASLAEVRSLARTVADHTDRLGALVNNAGIGTHVPGGGVRQESRDGHELRFAVNYLAGFALTRALLPLLRAGAPSRIVNVSSAGQAAIDFSDPMLERSYDGVRAYCQSKLAQVMFTFDLADELDGTGVTATALHPATYMPTKIVPSPVSTLAEGVDATLRLVAEPELDGVSGRYFNGVREARADPQAYDADARRRLAAISNELTAPG